MPFLQQGNFHSLEIICHHLPQWLEGEALARNYTLKTFNREKAK
jgi:hypothetical protein